ncbi:MAG: GspH/FimT family pseudopilin [Gammaproteobacteria bacterium]
MKNISGFTIIEVMIAIVIIGVLITIGVPSFQSTVMNNRLVTQTNLFVTSLNQARSEAVKQNQQVSICATNNGTSCATSGTNWENGWLVFVDRDGDGTIDDGDDCGDAATDDCILTIQEPLAGELTLSSDTRIITYSGNGTVDNNRMLALCDSRGADYARAIMIGNTGRPSTASKTEAPTLTCP